MLGRTSNFVMPICLRSSALRGEAEARMTRVEAARRGRASSSMMFFSFSFFLGHSFFLIAWGDCDSKRRRLLLCA